MNEPSARSRVGTAPSQTRGAGRLPARLRHRRTLLVPPVPPVPAHAGPTVRGAA
ncbi:hypothetical protein [Blastococcus mobilis]|uniref:Uncharacterized protein n=1 Tax=Blastococcus mobilis TaxID=1938746 RepID=A0A238Y250_9ACTN|nr:hypothetical protein [Blastococcus mobilis]SNR64871.1 hypothetical protein SAMN06272737_11725 [Blastococcus mobilis]